MELKLWQRLVSVSSTAKHNKAGEMGLDYLLIATSTLGQRLRKSLITWNVTLMKERQHMMLNFIKLFLFPELPRALHNTHSSIHAFYEHCVPGAELAPGEADAFSELGE